MFILLMMGWNGMGWDWGLPSYAMCLNLVGQIQVCKLPVPVPMTNTGAELELEKNGISFVRELGGYKPTSRICHGI